MLNLRFPRKVRKTGELRVIFDTFVAFSAKNSPGVVFSFRRPKSAFGSENQQKTVLGRNGKFFEKNCAEMIWPFRRMGLYLR